VESAGLRSPSVSSVSSSGKASDGSGQVSPRADVTKARVSFSGGGGHPLAAAVSGSRQLPKVMAGQKSPPVMTAGDAPTRTSGAALAPAPTNSKRPPSSSSAFTLAQAKDFLLGKSSAMRRKTATTVAAKPLGKLSGNISESSNLGNAETLRSGNSTSTRFTGAEGEPMFIDVPAAVSAERDDESALSALDQRHKRPATAHGTLGSIDAAVAPPASILPVGNGEGEGDEDCEPADSLDDLGESTSSFGSVTSASVAPSRKPVTSSFTAERWRARRC
jgi:hypothetical protein